MTYAGTTSYLNQPTSARRRRRDSFLNVSHSKVYIFHCSLFVCLFILLLVWFFSSGGQKRQEHVHRLKPNLSSFTPFQLQFCSERSLYIYHQIMTWVFCSWGFTVHKTRISFTNNIFSYGLPDSDGVLVYSQTCLL